MFFFIQLSLEKSGNQRRNDFQVTEDDTFGNAENVTTAGDPHTGYKSEVHISVFPLRSCLQKNSDNCLEKDSESPEGVRTETQKAIKLTTSAESGTGYESEISISLCFSLCNYLSGGGGHQAIILKMAQVSPSSGRPFYFGAIGGPVPRTKSAAQKSTTNV